jgi:hypothetical protein
MRLALMLLATLVLAADKPVQPVQSGNDVVDVEGFATVNRAEVTAALGHDPGFDLVLVRVTIAPKGENKVRVWLDDFTLISRKDGQRSQPLAPAQIAGRGSMVVTSTGVRSSGVGIGRNRGPIWGGIPGTGTRPRRAGGDQDVAESAPNETKATVNDGSGEANNPLLAVLKEKQLVEAEISEASSGYLYFLLDGKHKLKDLELMYKSTEGRLILDFVK